MGRQRRRLPAAPRLVRAEQGNPRRHRALRHHAEGIFMLETLFGSTLTLSSGRIIPTRWIGEQHVTEDLGRIPSFADWARAIQPEPWMGRAVKLHIVIEGERVAAEGGSPQ
jgi:hypothetical protein